ncbi:MAG: SgcJ/EcaC family oxidoreductase [Singulisphaera sp.]|nr:SgcJ/EcaC family oxidoreductase [Singulisphaera sp.]
MRPRLFCLLALPALMSGLTARWGLAEEPQDKAKEEAALLKNAEAFVEAFHKGDAKALAAFWAVDGDYTDQTGRQFKGREAIEEAFKGLFSENKGLKLRIDIASLRFVTPDVAVEDGTTSVIPPGGAPPSRARYTIVHVKKDGQWLLNCVRDAAFSPPTHYEHLRGLEWAIGAWAGETDQGEVARVSFDWSESQNFIISSITTTFKDISIGGATQWIGWDPVAKHLRSWTFETNGGFGEGTWARDDNKWVIKTTAVLRDGKKLAATNILTRIDADTMSWQARDRTADGKPLPDVEEIKMKRVR